MNEIFYSIDIETTGSTPANGSMLSLGAVAYSPDGVELGSWYDTFQVDKYDEDTMNWWKGFPQAYAEATVNPGYPHLRIYGFVEWVKAVQEAHSKDPSSKPNMVCMANPATFDFSFVYYLIDKHLGAKASPFRHRCMDMRSFIMGAFGLTFKEATLAKAYELMGRPDPKSGSYETNSHNALNDARDQGVLFMEILQYVRDMKQQHREVLQTLTNVLVESDFDNERLDSVEVRLDNVEEALIGARLRVRPTMVRSCCDRPWG